LNDNVSVTLTNRRKGDIITGGSSSGGAVPSTVSSTVPSYVVTNVPGTPATEGVYVWDEALGVWSNGTFYMKNTSASGYCTYWIYHKNAAPGPL
jgi:hypothetical protein